MRATAWKTKAADEPATKGRKQSAAAILRPGVNCWRQAHTDRASFLIDADIYFRTFAEAAERAEHSIFIIGWDLHSRTRLWRNTDPDLPDELGGFLNAIAARRRRLHIYVLDWDFAMLYAFEREILPVVKLGWRTHRRIHFNLDSQHPRAACHHQKIIVIDDALAFVGGLDLTIHRWDTPDHRADEPRRVLPNGKAYPPFHDVQIVVDGDAARALGEIARARWQRVTGRRPHRHSRKSDPWPRDLKPDVTDTEVAIARTEPAFEERPEVREVERLYIDGIEAAQRWIYIENQYLTAASAGAALERRLRAPNGPEVVLVTTRQCSGWLEEGTMGALRARFLQRLRDADRFGRLRFYYPVVPDDPGARLNVHSKVMIIDDRLARVGSANLSNRSFGLDTECDIAIEATGDTAVSQAIAQFRNRLLAEHLGCTPHLVSQRTEQLGSLIQAVETLRSKGRTLEPVQIGCSEWLVGLAPLADPEGPIDIDALTEQLLPEEVGRAPGHPLLRPAAYLLILALFAAAWRWTPLRAWLQPSVLESLIARWRGDPAAVFWILGTYMVGGLVAFPVTLLTIATTFVFGPLLGPVYALLGSLSSALTVFALGRALGRDLVRRLIGTRLDRIRRRLSRRGIAVIATVRMFPLAPFSLINLVAGVCQISLRDFVLGTVLGMLPGVLVLALFSHSIIGVATTPGLIASLGLVVTVAGVGFAALAAYRWHQRRLARGFARPQLLHSSWLAGR